jgi:hypothetical protein
VVTRPSSKIVYDTRTFITTLSQKYCEGLFVHTVAKLYNDIFSGCDNRLAELAKAREGGLLVLMGSGLSYDQIKEETKNLHNLRNSLVAEVYQRFNLESYEIPMDSVGAWMKLGIDSKGFITHQDSQFSESFKEALQTMEQEFLHNEEFKETLTVNTGKCFKTFADLQQLQLHN